MSTRTVSGFILKLGLLTILFFVVFTVSNTILILPFVNATMLPPTNITASLLGMLVMALVDTLLVALLILRSRWGGWRLYRRAPFLFYSGGIQ